MSVICWALRSITSNARSLRSSAATPPAMEKVSARSETAPRQRRTVVGIVTLILVCWSESSGGRRRALARVFLPLPQVFAVKHALRPRDLRPVVDRQPESLEMAPPRLLGMVLEMGATVQHRAVVEDLEVARLEQHLDQHIGMVPKRGEHIHRGELARRELVIAGGNRASDVTAHVVTVEPAVLEFVRGHAARNE